MPITATQDTRKLPTGVNAVADQAPVKAVEEAQYAEMYEAATLLGADREISDVKFAFDAQAEVVMALS